MNTLKEKAENNLKYILEMGENDTFISERGKLVPQEDFVQVNNLTDLEYAIYFTFHQYLLSDNMNKIYNHNLIQKLDTSIDNLYDNKQFNELLSEEHFGQIMEDIDNKLTQLKESYYYQSPFFIFFKRYYNLYNYCKGILNENNDIISRLLRRAQIDVHREYYKEEDDEKDSEEDGEDEGDNEEKEGGEKEGEEEGEEEGEKEGEEEGEEEEGGEEGGGEGEEEDSGNSDYENGSDVD